MFLKREKSVCIIILIICAIFLQANKCYAKKSDVDWSELKKYESYEYTSPLLASAVSVIPVWSGSFNAEFNSNGLLRVLFKTFFAGLVIHGLLVKDRDGSSLSNFLYKYDRLLLGSAILYDAYRSYEFVDLYNTSYASISVLPAISIADNSRVKIGGVNIYLTTRF